MSSYCGRTHRTRIFLYTYIIMPTDHLHTSLKEFINKLIVVMSQLDATDAL